jgi:hypothetical protein
LGHLQRAISVANELRDAHGASVSFFVDEKSLSILKKSEYSESTEIQIIENSSLLTESGFRIQHWEKVFDSIPDNEIIISDNIIKPIVLRNNTILIANFFWHEVVDYSVGEKKYIEHLLLKHKPRIIGHHFFSMHNVQAQMNFFPYGFRCNSDTVNKPNNQNSILVASGASGRAINDFVNNCDYIVEICKNYENIYLDKYLVKYLSNKIKNYQLATFSKQMFNSLNRAIVRPGLGTVRELYLRQIPMFLIYEDNNAEMKHLAIKIKQIGLDANTYEMNNFHSFKKKNILEKELSYPTIAQNIISTYA